VWFARHDDARTRTNFFAEAGEVGVGELVKNQISDYGRIIRKPIERPQIPAMPGLIRRPVCGTRPEIQPGHGHAAAPKPQRQFACARAELERRFPGSEQRRQRALEPSVAADNVIRQTQIPTIMQRIGMIGRKSIEQFRLKRALHGWAKKSAAVRQAKARRRRQKSGGENSRFIISQRRLPRAAKLSSVRRTFMSVPATPASAPDTPALPAVPVLPVDLIAEAASNFPHRPSWDEYFMATAVLISSRSNCERLHVGCVLVTGGERKNRIVTAGYNGFLPDTPHVSRVRDGHEQATVHAEQNAVADAARRGSSVEGCVAYVTHYPCINCAKILAAAGIAEIRYRADYLNDPLVAPLLADAGVKVLKL
jgi:dCMP deaminase